MTTTTTTTIPSKESNGQHRKVQQSSSSSTHCYRWYERMFGCTYYGLKLYRILLGALLTSELILRYRFLHPFYCNEGTLPLDLMLPNVDSLYKVVCIHCYNDTIIYQQFLLTIQVICSVMFTMGIKVRITAMMSWILYLSLTLRNTWLNFILDRYFHYLLFYSIILAPYMKNDNENVSKKSISNTEKQHLKTKIVTNLATFAIKMQILWIYADAGWGKYSDPLQGWTYNAKPLPALDTYTRHTVGAQYVYAILQPEGLRILTPIVVYIELLAAPMALIGSLMKVNFITNMAIFLIVGLHIGISITLRNTVLLSLVAATAWCVYLPPTSYSKGIEIAEEEAGRKGGQTNGKVSDETSKSAAMKISSIISNICLVTLICGSVWFETMLDESCDSISMKHIWSTLLHNRWNVFVGAEEYVTWEIAPGLLQDGSVVDVWSRSNDVNWSMPGGGAPCTSTSRPGRWRSFPYLAEITEGEEGDALWGYLCKQWNDENNVGEGGMNEQINSGRRLVKYNFFMLQADVLPNMAFSSTRKRLIHTYECKYNDNNSTEGSDSTVKDEKNDEL